MKTIAIIGGGPAGAMAAEKLALQGTSVGSPRVVVFEEKLGWEKPCGGGLPYKALRRYPFLLAASDEHKCVRDAELVAGNGSVVCFRLREPLVVYSRSTLNRLLLRRAQEAGTEIVQDRVLNFRRAGAGWRLDGRRGDYSADYLILAAGARTRLRSLLAGPLMARDFMLTFGYYAPGVDDLLRIQFFEDFEGYAWAFPRSDHLSLGICGKVSEARMPALRERLHGFMKKFGYPGRGEAAPRPFRSAPVFSHLLPALSVESWSNMRLAGSGWALAGDAAGLVDPVTGEGIYFAMRSGEMLAEALLEGPPDAYPARVWGEFGRKLALGARLSRYFYHEDFLGKPTTTRLVEFSSHSETFRELVQDLLEGSQSYSGLAARLYRTLANSFLEMAADLLRGMLAELSAARSP